MRMRAITTAVVFLAAPAIAAEPITGRFVIAHDSDTVDASDATSRPYYMRDTLAAYG
jgi:hypothetical protein